MVKAVSQAHAFDLPLAGGAEGGQPQEKNTVGGNVVNVFRASLLRHDSTTQQSVNRA